MPIASVEDVTSTDGHNFDAYFAAPDGKAKGGVVIVQEIFGVNGHIRGVCDQYASYGYAAVAPALFDRVERGVELGYEGEDRERGRAIRAKVAEEDAVRDVAACFPLLAEYGPIGVVGYCWGGTLAFLAATRLSPACAVGYYGGGIAGHKDEAARCPLMLHFGEHDRSIPLDQVEAIRKAQPEAEVFVYEGAEHGFNCNQRASWNEAAAKQALDRTLEFLGRHAG